MYKFSAQYVFTNNGPPLKRGVITTTNDGTIVKVEKTDGNFQEKAGVEFHNGIIIPGFVNCHTHLELSHLKGIIPPGTGLAEFIKQIRSIRGANPETIISSALSADQEMFRSGVVLCSDICNTDLTFDLKKSSTISYINLIELFGIDASKAERRIDETTAILKLSREKGFETWLVPHSVYSLSARLFRLLLKETGSNRITSLHFMESDEERIFLKEGEGEILRSYRESGLLTGDPESVGDHSSAVLKEITPSGNLILVHNTFTDRKTIIKVNKRKRVYWCLCPRSNLYIGNKLPPLDLMIEEGCEIVIGTDSLASNRQLSILGELVVLQNAFPRIGLEDLVKWSSFNGAKALGKEDYFGTIAPGKRPGLLLIRNVDLTKMKLLPESSVRRLI
jgi:cytosine/adenosine deaminase-related metal-dependent hydrolase